MRWCLPSHESLGVHPKVIIWEVSVVVVVVLLLVVVVGREVVVNHAFGQLTLSSNNDMTMMMVRYVV